MDALLRVMYAPVEYIHPERLQPQAASPALKQIINRHLLEHYQLPLAVDFTLQTADLSRCVVEAWFSLRGAAGLLGCKLARAALAQSGELAGLPLAVQRFIALPVPCPVWALPAGDHFLARVEALGARYLSGLLPSLPPALALRFPLLFAPEVLVSLPTEPLNRTLLNIALNYAQTDCIKPT